MNVLGLINRVIGIKTLRLTKSTPQPPSSSKLKSTENWCICTFMSTYLASPLLFFTTPLSIFTLNTLEMSTVSFKALAKLQSRKLWVLHVLRSTTFFGFGCWTQPSWFLEKGCPVVHPK
jgi:hypothetical protein